MASVEGLALDNLKCERVSLGQAGSGKAEVGSPYSQFADLLRNERLLMTHLLQNRPAYANAAALCQGRPQSPPLTPIAHLQLLFSNGQPLLQQAHDVGDPAYSMTP